MKLHVKPIYGWGWFEAGTDKAVDVPPSFALDAEVVLSGEPFGLLRGMMKTPDHPLSGMWIQLSPRAVPFNGNCNLSAFSEKPAEIDGRGAIMSGYAQVEEI